MCGVCGFTPTICCSENPSVLRNNARVAMVFVRDAGFIEGRKKLKGLNRAAISNSDWTGEPGNTPQYFIATSMNYFTLFEGKL